MSSILNALRKLEAEKAAQQTESAGEEFQAESAQADLLGKGSGERGLHISPAVLIVGGAVFMVAVVAVSTAVAVMATRPRLPENSPTDGANPAPVAKVLPAPASEAPPAPSVVTEAPVLDNAPPAPPEEANATLPSEPKAAPGKPAAPPAPEPRPVLAEVTPPPPAPVEEAEPMVVALAEPPAAEAEVLVEPETLAEPPEEPLFEAPTEPLVESAAAALPWQPPAEPLDVDALPTLRASERTRFGLDGLRLNMLREANKNRPNGLAIINLNRIYIGEMIPGTQARLIAVERHAIGIEITGTGDRFRIEH